MHLYQLIITTSYNAQLFIWKSKWQIIHTTNMGINLQQQRNVNQTAIKILTISSEKNVTSIRWASSFDPV